MLSYLSGMKVSNIKREACVVLRASTQRLFRQQGDTNITARKKLFSGKADEADETAGRVMQLCLTWTHSDEDVHLGEQFNMRVVGGGTGLADSCRVFSFAKGTSYCLSSLPIERGVVAR
jgi:hypothetical protein